MIFLLGMGQFTVPLLLGRTEQINVLTTEMFYLTLNPPVDYGLGAVLGLPILIIGIVLVVVQKFCSGCSVATSSSRRAHATKRA